MFLKLKVFEVKSTCSTYIEKGTIGRKKSASLNIEFSF